MFLKVWYTIDLLKLNNTLQQSSTLLSDMHKFYRGHQPVHKFWHWEWHIYILMMLHNVFFIKKKLKIYVHILCKHIHVQHTRLKLNYIPLTMLNRNCSKNVGIQTDTQNEIISKFSCCEVSLCEIWKLYNKNYLSYFVTRKVITDKFIGTDEQGNYATLIRALVVSDSYSWSRVW